jgi:hypothetical protein
MALLVKRFEDFKFIASAVNPRLPVDRQRSRKEWNGRDVKN